MKYNRSFLLKNHVLLVLLLFLCALAACEDEPGCVSDNTNVVGIEFYKIDDTTQRNRDEGVEVGIFLVGGDNSSDDPLDGLPLNPSENVSTFYIMQNGINGIQIDTIVLRYKREQQLISPDCGPTQRYFDLEVDTLTTLDSVRVVERELGELTGVNIEIYTCQDTFYTEDIRINFQERDSTVRTDSLFVQAIRDEAGQTLVENDTIVGNLRLPINPLAERASFTFELAAHNGEPARTETLVLSYQQDTVRFAEKCRLQTRYFNLDTLSTTFDSVRIANRELAVDVPLNLEIIDLLE